MAGKLHHGDELSEIHEINVVPFIDIVLVLLIIFMVAAPIAIVDVNVELPTSTAEAAPRPDRPVILTIEADHRLYLGTDPVSAGDLGAALDDATQGNTQAHIYLRADKRVDYGTVMQALNTLRAVGYHKIVLVGLEDSPGGPTS